MGIYSKMMKQSILLIIGILLGFTSMAQEKVNCGKKTSYEVNSGGSHNFLPFLNCSEFDFRIENAKLSQIPDSVKNRNERYLRRRLGDEFYEVDLTFEGVKIVERDSVEFPRRNMGGKHCDNPSRYAFLYSFEIMEIKYEFSTVYDEEGNRVSRNQVPNLNNDPDVFNFIPICDIIELAQKDKINRGKEIIDIRPKYDQSYNSMLWIVRKPSVNSNDEYTYYRIIYYDAVTGEVIFRKKVKELKAATYTMDN